MHLDKLKQEKSSPLASHTIREKVKQLHNHFSEFLGQCNEIRIPPHVLASKERFKHYSLHNMNLVDEVVYRPQSPRIIPKKSVLEE